MHDQDCIYLTTAQIETLFKLSVKGEPVIGIQIRSNARDDSDAHLDAVLESDRNVGWLSFAFITPAGSTAGWSR